MMPGFHSLAALGRSIGRIESYVRICLVAVIFFGLTFASQFLWGRPDVGAVIVAFTIAGLLGIWQCGGVKQCLLIAREKFLEWAHTPPKIRRR